MAYRVSVLDQSISITLFSQSEEILDIKGTRVGQNEVMIEREKKKRKREIENNYMLTVKLVKLQGLLRVPTCVFLRHWWITGSSTVDQRDTILHWC